MGIASRDLLGYNVGSLSGEVCVKVEHLLEIATYNIARCWRIASLKYGADKIGPMPKVTISKRLKVTAGWAYFDKNEVKLCYDLFVEHMETFVQETIPHEVAHLVAAKVYEDTGHGKGWKSVMVECYKLEPARCHNMANSKYEARKANVETDN